MTLVELEYEERADGLLYPILDMGEDKLEQLGRFGKARLEYLHDLKFEFYRELLLTGKLAEHCENFEKQADEMCKKLFQKYLKDNPPPSGEDFFKRVAVFEQADSWAREVTYTEQIFV